MGKDLYATTFIIERKSSRVIPAQAGIHAMPQVALCYGFLLSRELQWWFITHSKAWQAKIVTPLFTCLSSPAIHLNHLGLHALVKNLLLHLGIAPRAFPVFGQQPARGRGHVLEVSVAVFAADV